MLVEYVNTNVFYYPTRYRVRPRSEARHVARHPEYYNNHNPPFSIRDNSTTINPILDAIAAIELAEPRERLSYRAAGTKFNVNAKTLRRRY
jgi:hypothetical protein